MVPTDHARGHQLPLHGEQWVGSGPGDISHLRKPTCGSWRSGAPGSWWGTPRSASELWVPRWASPTARDKRDLLPKSPHPPPFPPQRPLAPQLGRRRRAQDQGAQQRGDAYCIKFPLFVPFTRAKSKSNVFMIKILLARKQPSQLPEPCAPDPGPHAPSPRPRGALASGRPPSGRGRSSGRSRGPRALPAGRWGVPHPQPHRRSPEPGFLGKRSGPSDQRV